MYAIELRDITKSFNGVVTNDHIDFLVREGEVHSLLGENGAGKTTLMNILYGIYRADSGSISIYGEKARIETPLHATQYGIAMVHQHFMLIDNMTVAENVVLGCEPHNGALFDAKKALESVAEISQKYGLAVDPGQLVGELSVGTKQRVEIIKALYRNANIIILDEPTAVLTPQEVDELFSVLRGLREMGKTIIIITHKLKETLELADTVTILRQGKVVKTLPVQQTDASLLSELMIGRLVSFQTKKQPMQKDQPVVLRLQGINLSNGHKKALEDISFELHAGEILGVVGVEGNGQTELIETITGLRQPGSGTIFVSEKAVERPTPKDMLQRGLGHIPEDRGKRGLVAEFDLSENLILGYQRTKEFCSKGMLKKRRIRAYAQKCMEDFDVRGEGVDLAAGSLSGGNQEKLVIARVLSENPDVIVAAQPTRGVDIGAIEFIHAKLVEMRDQGKGILLISAELDELVKLSDRIAVLYEGRIVALRDTSDFDERTLGALMTNKAAAEQ